MDTITGWDIFMVTSEKAESVEGWEHVRELRRELKAEWDELWKTRHDDQIRAEGVSSNEFERLFVNHGEVILATRDFKPLSFRDILEAQLGSDVAGRVEPDPAVGGWGKFVKNHLPKQKQVNRERPKIEADLSQHQRKGGRGWLNKARTWRKTRQNRLEY